MEIKHFKIKTMKKVLIALDYDPSSEKVAQKGYALAKQMGAKVVLTHVLAELVYYSSVGYSPIAGFDESMNLSVFPIETMKRLKEVAQNFLNQTKAILNDKSVKTLLLEGDTADMILETAKSIDADIIVLGTHSRKWLENILVGSVTESVLKKSTFPLFLIPIKKR